jgi:hypothetical protein
MSMGIKFNKRRLLFIVTLFSLFSWLCFRWALDRESGNLIYLGMQLMIRQDIWLHLSSIIHSLAMM